MSNDRRVFLAFRNETKEAKKAAGSIVEAFADMTN